MPVAIIHRRIVIDQMLGEITLTPTPTDMQVFGQERSDYHPYAVVHKTSRIKLSHTCINYWKASRAFSPALKMTAIVIPNQVVILRVERFAKNMRVMKGDMGEKITPVKLP